MTRLFRVTNPWKQNPLICFISKQVDIEKNSLFSLKSSLKKILQPPCDRLSKWSKSSFLCIHTLEIWCWRSSHKRLSLFLHRLESGLPVWLLLASGTLTSMTQNKTWKGLVYWSLLSCCTWILRPSCKWVQAACWRMRSHVEPLRSTACLSHSQPTHRIIRRRQEEVNRASSDWKNCPANSDCCFQLLNFGISKSNKYTLLRL